MKQDEFRSIIAQIEILWGPMESLKKQLYAESLSDLDYKIVNAALKKLVQTSKFMPKIAEIRSEYFDIISPLQTPEEACALARHAFRIFGRRQWQQGKDYIKEQNPLAFKIVERIGYINMCNNPEEDNAIAEFRGAYKKALTSYAAERMTAEKTQTLIDAIKENAGQGMLALTANE